MDSEFIVDTVSSRSQQNVRVSVASVKRQQVLIYVLLQRRQWASGWTAGQNTQNNNNINNNNNNNQAPWNKLDHAQDDAETKTQNEGLNPTPRPIPSWFHPPMALPPPPKEEIVEPWSSLPPSEASSKDDVELDKDLGKDNLEAGVTPPLMSPLASPMGGMVSPFPGMENMPPGVMDPRHILHLLTRKVRQLSAGICSNG